MRNDFDEVKKSQTLAERMPHHKQIAVCQALERLLFSCSTKPLASPHYELY